MTGKLTFLAGLGVGYVLGARSGRERYEQIAGRAQQLWRDPRVQEKAEQAQQLAKEKAEQAQQLAKEKGEQAQQLMKEKAGQAQQMVKEKVTTSAAPAETVTGPGAGTSGGLP
jgi:gas vesicle protein